MFQATPLLISDTGPCGAASTLIPYSRVSIQVLAQADTASEELKRRLQASEQEARHASVRERFRKSLTGTYPGLFYEIEEVVY